MKLLVIKSAFRWFPEVFLIASVLYYWILTASIFNPIAIILLIALIVQMNSNNKTMGIILSSVFILITGYMFLALFSDIVNVDTFYPEGLRLLIVGGLYLAATLFFSVSLFIKNINKQPAKISLK